MYVSYCAKRCYLELRIRLAVTRVEAMDLFTYYLVFSAGRTPGPKCWALYQN